MLRGSHHNSCASTSTPRPTNTHPIMLKDASAETFPAVCERAHYLSKSRHRIEDLRKAVSRLAFEDLEHKARYPASHPPLSLCHRWSILLRPF
jgi:hypothetical protein